VDVQVIAAAKASALTTFAVDVTAEAATKKAATQMAATLSTTPATATMATTATAATVSSVATSLNDAAEFSTNDDVAQDVLQVDIVRTVDTKAKAKPAVSSRNARSSRLHLLRVACIVVVAIATTLLFAARPPPPQPSLLRASGARVAADISDVEKYQLRDASGVTIGGGWYHDACAYVATSTLSLANGGFDAWAMAARLVFATTTMRTGVFATSLKTRMSDTTGELGYFDNNGDVTEAGKQLTQM
jgi:hypothetical protein